MNLLAGQNSAAVELQQSQSPARLGQAPGQAACLPDGAGQQAVNQFVRLLDGIEVRSRQFSRERYLYVEQTQATLFA